MPRFIYALLGLALIGLALAMTSSPMSYIDPTSLLLVLGGGLLFTCAQHGFVPFFQAMGVGEAATTRAELSAQVCVLQGARNAFCGMAVVGYLVGLVTVLMNLDDPVHIGPAMAVTILTALYALFVSEVVVAPRINALQARAHTLAESPTHASSTPTGGARAAVTLALVVVSQLAMMGILIVIIP